MKYFTCPVVSMPGAAIDKSQDVQSSHLSRNVEESEAKSLFLDPEYSMGNQGKRCRMSARKPHTYLPVL